MQIAPRSREKKVRLFDFFIRIPFIGGGPEGLAIFRSPRKEEFTQKIRSYSTPPAVNAALAAGVARWRSTPRAASAAVAPVISAAS